MGRNPKQPQCLPGRNPASLGRPPSAGHLEAPATHPRAQQDRTALTPDTPTTARRATIPFTDTSTTSNDTYRWGTGSGLDTLTDSGGTLDHVDLFAGITKSQLKFVKNGNNLELSVTGQTDKLTINSWYVSSANQIEEFRRGDGSKVLASEVQGLLSAMAAFTAASAGFEGGRATIQPIGQYTDLLAPSAMM